MTSTIFNNDFNDFVRKYFIKGNEHLINDVNSFEFDYLNSVNSISEQLLLHDRISFKVYGENIPLANLINIYGIKGTEDLLDQGAIEFVLWNPGVTYLVNDIPGLYPLQSMGKFTSSVHSDPEASIKSGLKFLSNPLPRRDRRNITRKVLKKYKLPSKKLPNDAVEFGHQGYNNNLFEGLGLPKNKELIELDKNERALLCDLAIQCLELIFLGMNNYSSKNNFNLLKINKSEFRKLKNANAVDELVDTVFEIENIPNFFTMFSKSLIDVKDVPKFRKSKASKQFREWIDKVSHSTDKSDITKEYLDSLVNSRSFLETNQGKLIKAVSITALGTAGGAFAGPAVGAATSLGLGLFDYYVLDNISKGWTPKYYIDKKIKPLTNKN